MKYLITLIIVINILPSKAVNPQKYLYCENLSLKQEQLSIRADKMIKNDKDVSKVLKSLEYVNGKINRVCK